MNNNKLLIGCFADDFTGASDIGSFFVKGGLNTILINGIPKSDFIIDDNVQAVVIALKSRSQKIENAISDSLQAYKFFEEKNCKKIYFKYCSTFDSTKKGNIGPVIDAILEKYNIPYTIICPSLVVNGRTVKDGCLFVNGVPLDESHMKDHPLNPMWDCNIKNLIEAQGKYTCSQLNIEEIKNNESYLSDKINLLLDKHSHFYLSPDYYEDTHGEIIAKAFKNLRFLTGGSGLAEHVAVRVLKDIEKPQQKDTTYIGGVPGTTLILAGSCSVATKEQIKNYIEDGGTSIELDPIEIKEGKVSAEKIIDKINNSSITSILIHTTGNGLNSHKLPRTTLSQLELSSLLEDKMAEIALKANQAGIKKIITAGGETSGAITKALGFTSFYLNQIVAPGVPVMTPIDDVITRLILKSGNFGQPNFFNKAIDLISLSENEGRVLFL